MKLSLRKSIDEIKTFSRIFVERPRFAMATMGSDPIVAPKLN